MTANPNSSKMICIHGMLVRMAAADGVRSSSK